MAAVYFYEQILTFEQEVNCLWLRKKKSLLVPSLYVVLHLSMALYLILHIAPAHGASFEVRHLICMRVRTRYPRDHRSPGMSV